MTRIGPIVHIEDPKEAFSIDYVHVKKNIKVEETAVIDIITTSYPKKKLKLGNTKSPNF